MKTIVWITTQFEGIHSWLDAPKEVSFLRSYHRHIFHVKLAVKVTHLNRDVEFVLLKRRVDQYLQETFVGKGLDLSCEQMAEQLFNEFGAEWVEVSEDGENGARVEATKNDRERYKCFAGIEAEGPWRGQPMLFVPGDCTVDRLQTVLKCLQSHWFKPYGIYLGAGGYNTIAALTLQLALDTGMPLTIETNARDAHQLELMERAKKRKPDCIVVSMHSCQDANYIKTVGDGKIVWRLPHGTLEYVTALDDPLFEQDFDLE